MDTHSSILPGKFHGQWSLVGCSSWGRKESVRSEHARAHTHTHTHTCRFINRNKCTIWWGILMVVDAVGGGVYIGNCCNLGSVFLINLKLFFLRVCLKKIRQFIVFCF